MCRFIHASLAAVYLFTGVAMGYGQDALLSQEGELLRAGTAGEDTAIPAIVSKDQAVKGALPAPLEGSEGSVALWVRPENWEDGAGWRVLINWRAILSAGGEGFQSLMLRGSPEGRLVFTLGELEERKADNVEFPLLSGMIPEWNHVVITWDATEIRVYVNGEQAVDHPRRFRSERPLGATLQLGGVHGSGEEQGRTAIGGFSVYDVALTPETVAQLAAKPPTSDKAP